MGEYKLIFLCYAKKPKTRSVDYMFWKKAKFTFR